MSETDNLVACATCGTLIEGQHEHRLTGPLGTISMLCNRTQCRECEYQEAFRVNRCVARRPYRMPFPRPTKDGKMPAALKQELAKELG